MQSHLTSCALTAQANSCILSPSYGGRLLSIDWSCATIDPVGYCSRLSPSSPGIQTRHLFSSCSRLCSVCLDSRGKGAIGLVAGVSRR